MLPLSIIQRSPSKYKKGILHILECGHRLTYSPSASRPQIDQFQDIWLYRGVFSPMGILGFWHEQWVFMSDLVGYFQKKSLLI